MKKIPEHIMLDYSKTPCEHLCINCGNRRPLHLPASINDVVKQCEAFAESHKYCKPPMIIAKDDMPDIEDTTQHK